ncbi:MAG: histone deacetylase, partial [Phycisphaerales bacterium]|nr:histone deacetylase [Phycisphaerales bacterium]
VHHGNGTQHIFEHRNDVLVVNMHQWPMWPETGLADEIGYDAGAGHTINVPMAEGRRDEDYEAVMHNLVRPIAHAYRPDLVLVSAGFDAHERDPLGGMRVTTEGFGRLCARIRRIALDVCDGRLGLFLEGGYDLGALTASTLACLDALRAPECPAVPAALTYSPDVEKTWAQIQRYWPGARD